MDKETALEKTKRKFTNLLDGQVLNGISVGHILDYYETLLLQSHLEGKPTTVRKPIGNIESNFIEDEIDYMHGDDYSEMYGGL
jgi:hypothetical protein